MKDTLRKIGEIIATLMIAAIGVFFVWVILVMMQKIISMF